MSTTINDIAKFLKSDDKKGDTSFWGIVHSTIEDGEGNVTGYNVSLDGSANGAVKCNKVVGAKQGDQVLVTLRANGEAVVVATKGGDSDALKAISDAATADGKAVVADGKATAADNKATQAQSTANTANSNASTALSTANTAYNKAQTIENHFWYDSNGVHVSQDSTIYSSTPNTLINSGGFAVRKGDTELSTFSDTLVEIGKNSESAVIQMCGDQARLSYADGSVYLGATTGDMTIQVGTQQGLTVKGTSDSGGVIILQSLYASGRTPARRVYMPTIYQGRNTGAAPVGVNVNGWLATTGDSTRKIKHDIRSLENEELDPHNLYNLPVIQFKYNLDYLSDEDERYDTDLIGFIAEDVENVYPIACDHDNGEVRNWNHRYIIPPMLKLIQEQHEEIELLKARVERLENK